MIVSSLLLAAMALGSDGEERNVSFSDAVVKCMSVKGDLVQAVFLISSTSDGERISQTVSALPKSPWPKSKFTSTGYVGGRSFESHLEVFSLVDVPLENGGGYLTLRSTYPTDGNLTQKQKDAGVVNVVKLYDGKFSGVWSCKDVPPSMDKLNK